MRTHAGLWLYVCTCSVVTEAIGHEGFIISYQSIHSSVQSILSRYLDFYRIKYLFRVVNETEIIGVQKMQTRRNMLVLLYKMLCVE